MNSGKEVHGFAMMMRRRAVLKTSSRASIYSHNHQAGLASLGQLTEGDSLAEQKIGEG